VNSSTRRPARAATTSSQPVGGARRGRDAVSDTRRDTQGRCSSEHRPFFFAPTFLLTGSVRQTWLPCSAAERFAGVWSRLLSLPRRLQVRRSRGVPPCTQSCCAVQNSTPDHGFGHVPWTLQTSQARISSRPRRQRRSADPGPLMTRRRAPRPAIKRHRLWKDKLRDRCRRSHPAATGVPSRRYASA
jgi:hypothetical protein